MDKVLTISVAAYKVENYIETLLDSIIEADRQSEIEVLVINDGSTDKTLEIAGRYEAGYPDTIRVIDKENGGHGSTVNRGIKEAKGKYFKTIDGDDWVEPEGLRKLVDHLKSSDADMVLTDYRECYTETGTTKDIKREKTRQAIPQGETKDWTKTADKCERIQMHMVSFKTAILRENNIRLDEHCFYVDLEYVCFTLPYIKTVEYPDIMVYQYRLGRPGQSMTSESLRKNYEQHIRVNLAIIESYTHISDDIPAVRRHIEELLAEHTLLTYRILLSFGYSKDKGERIKEVDTALQKGCPAAYEAITDKRIALFRKKQYNNYRTVWLLRRFDAVKEHI